MATSLPNFGTLSYNGIDLSSPYTETLSAAFRPIPDTSGRTVKYVEITLKFKTIVAYSESTSTEVAMTNIRNSLTAYGGAFALSGRGLGNIYANVPGRVEKDVNYGPKPRVVSLRATNQYAVEVIFEIVVCLPQCTTSASYQNQLMAANYDLSFDIDEASQTKRTFKGHIEIPATRIAQGIRKLPDNADDYLLSIIPSVLSGFRRVISRHLNEAKTLLEVTVTDTEMGTNIPPPGIVSVQAEQSHANTTPFAFAQYSGTISAEYKLQKGTDPEVARKHFFALVDDRFAAMEDSDSFKTRFTDGSTLKGKVLPTIWSAGEPDIYGDVKRCKFAVQYLATASITTLLTAGLWRQVPDSSWTKWAKSMVLMSNPRGLADLRFKNSEDAIVDLCQSVTVNRLKTPPDSKLKSRRRPDDGEPPECPPDESWIDFENKIRLVTIDPTIPHNPLPAQESKLTSRQNPTPQGIAWSDPSIPRSPKTIIQYRGAPLVMAIMEGFGVRYLYGIDEPKLVSIGGANAVKANQIGDGFATMQRGMLQIAKWRARYILDATPLLLVAPPPFSIYKLGKSVISRLKGKL